MEHEEFIQWVTDRKGRINGVAPGKLPGKGIGLVATRKIQVCGNTGIVIVSNVAP
jgi:hypothetical protein